MTAPDFKVEIAFGSTYATPAASRSWTDVTAYAAEGDEATIGVGRGDEFSTADANSLSLSLNNTDGRFSPGYTSGAYYPNVKIGVPVRVTSTPSGEAASVRFTGYVDDWATGWPGGSQDYAVTTISARSRMARLGISAPLGNVVYEESKRDSPTAYYQLDNLVDAYGGASLVLAGTGSAVAWDGTGPGTDGLSAVRLTGGRHLRATGVDGLHLDFWFATTTSGLQALLMSSGGIGLVISSGNKLGFQNGLLGVTEMSTATVNDGLVHHVAWDNTTGQAWLDGVSLGTAPATMAAERWVGGDPSLLSATLTGTLAHLGFYGTALTTARALDHYDAGSDGFAGETATARLARYAAYATTPAAEYAFDAGALTPMAHIDTAGQTPLALMQRVEETDGGVLHDGRDGVLTYVARSARYNRATDESFFSYEIEGGASPKLDRSALVNEVVATVADGSDPQETVTAKNATSYADYGPHKQDIELATTDANEAHGAAWWRVNAYGEPLSRIGILAASLEPMAAADQTAALNLTVGSRVEVANWPSQVGTALSLGFFVEGYTETIGAGYHRIEFNVSPAAPHVGLLTLDSATYGQLDEERLAY